MNSKYLNNTINNLLVLKSFCKKMPGGTYCSYFKLKCLYCGQEIERSRVSVLNGEAKCKCSYQNKRHNVNGLSNTKLNRVYRSMIERCENPKCKVYKYYGGRGIQVCKEWKDDFQSFFTWSINNGYKEEILPNGKNKLTIDRIDNNGNYEPSNCRWVTMSIQNKNKRTKDVNEYV